MAPRLVILYEDSRGPLKRFPLHELVMKSAADLVALELHELLRRVVEVPKRGVLNVLEEVGRCDRFLGKGARLLVWVDKRRHQACAPTSAALCAGARDLDDQGACFGGRRRLTSEASDRGSRGG